MKLNVSEALHNPGQEYAFHGEQAIAPVDIGGETVVFDTAVLQGAFFTDDDGGVTVDGKLTTVAHAQCANCLEPASTDIEAPFHETFVRGGDPNDDEIFAYEGYQVEFDKLAMSYAVMALPIRFLCKEDCKGLCPRCGMNLNHGSCNCKPDTDPRLAVLEQLLDDKH